MDDVNSANLASGMFQTAINYVGGRQTRKQQKQIQRDEDQARNRRYNYEQQQYDQAQEQLNRDAYYGQEGNKANINNRGLSQSGSIAMANRENIEDQRARRYKQLEDRQQQNTADFLTNDDIIKHQRKIASINHTMQLMSSLYGSGASGYLGASQ